MFRRGTTAKPEMTDEEKDKSGEEFVTKLRDVIVRKRIPAEIVVNMDESGNNMDVTDDSTLEQKGAATVAIRNLGNRAHMTSAMAISAAGTLLPSWLIFAGKTDAVIPRDDDGHVLNLKMCVSTQSRKARSAFMDGDLFQSYIEEILVPYRARMIEQLGLRDTQWMALVLDNHASHQTAAVLKKLDECYMVPVFVPANMTNVWQPLDQDVNALAKVSAQFSCNIYTQIINRIKQQYNNNIKCIFPNFPGVFARRSYSENRMSLIF